MKCFHFTLKVEGEISPHLVSVLADTQEEAENHIEEKLQFFGGNVSDPLLVGKSEMGPNVSHQMIDGRSMVPRFEKMVHTMKKDV